MTVATDLDHLRRAIEVSHAARAAGNHPFGAVLVGPDGAAVLEAENTVVTERDVTGHAETNLVREAGRAHPPEELGAYTLYTSCEPCAMCAGAIYWAGVGRVVFALSESGLRDLTGDRADVPTLAHPCRLVLGAGNRRVEVSGPHLEDDAAAAHRGFWA
ncbi:nucleoside deaminase [Nocardioides rubriscoriae]|uniref:nucleoside deaminase n=1 Tax=Nocardioides rubriscoriae TaxID=642762 RepID=UPI0011DFFCC6|nr:nucleoside deaminase [Nocardioides rubriscoriae]